MKKAVTVTDASGRSALAYFGEPHQIVLSVPRVVVTELWASDAVPPAVDGPDSTLGDESVAVELAPGAFRCRFVELPPVQPGEEPFYHRTPTLDVVVVMSGAVTVLLEDGSETHLGTGDTIVQRATTHAWRTEGNQPCTLVSFTVGLGPEATAHQG